ncbi:MAG: LuxR C-terminal-related transcriptional regulator [Vampirovibrionia bacterium]
MFFNEGLMSRQPALLIIEEKSNELGFLTSFGYKACFLFRDNSLCLLLDSFNDPVDLLIVNLSFNFIINLGLLDRFRESKQFATTPIIVISSFSDKKEEILALRSGVDDCIKRPFDIDILLARIDSTLRRSYWNKTSVINIASLPFLNIPSDLIDLTVRERTILNMIARGFSNIDISEKLCLSNLTVKTHVKNLFKKLGVSNRTEAILVGINLGLVDNY